MEPPRVQLQRQVRAVLVAADSDTMPEAVVYLTRVMLVEMVLLTIHGLAVVVVAQRESGRMAQEQRPDWGELELTSPCLAWLSPMQLEARVVGGPILPGMTILESVEPRIPASAVKVAAAGTGQAPLPVTAATAARGS